jgi:prepilin-type N-terminal cleavage/methylation domain-containing protein
MEKYSPRSALSSAITTTDLQGRRSAGFTIIEMLIAMFVGGVVLAAVFTGVFSSRNLMQTDLARTNANQNLRDVMDVLSTELRQSGQSLQGVIPAMALTSSGSDAAGWNSSITSWRAPVGEYLIACQALAGTPSTIALQSTDPTITGAYNGCTSGGQEAVRTQWSDYLTKYPNARLYVYDPVAKVGEMINVTAASSSAITVSGTLTNVYPATASPRLYLIETRTFGRTGNILMVSRDLAADERMAPNITSFKVEVQTCTTAVTPVCTWNTAFTPSSTTLWTSISAIRVSLKGQERVNNKTSDRTLTSNIFPRNTLNAN